MRKHQALELHEIGAVVPHVLTSLTAVAATGMWRVQTPTVVARALAAAVFALTFPQAAMGHGRMLYIHVPLAMLATTRRRRRRSPGLVCQKVNGIEDDTARTLAG